MTAADSGADPENDRLAQLLGPAAELLRPTRALLAGTVVWIVLGLATGRWLAAALCCWAPVLLTAALWLERPWLQRLPFPPVTVLTLVGVLRWGFGAFLLILAGPDLPNDLGVWSRGLEGSQLLWATVSSAIVLAGFLNRRLLRRLQIPPLSQRLRRQLPTLTLLLAVFSFAYVLVGVISGTLDRGSNNYFYWVGKLWRADTVFAPFIRLKDLFFLLVPISVQQCFQQRRNGTASPLRWLAPLLVGLAIGSIALGGLTGGRGLMLAPLVLLVAGLWLTELRPVLLRWLVVALLVVALLFIPLMGSLRESGSFKNTEIQDLPSRVAVIHDAIAGMRPNRLQLANTGRDLFPSSDPYLFQPPGSEQKPAGWRGLHGLLYLWIPKHLYPHRPEINDGHLIAKEIMGNPEAGVIQGLHVWFPNVSFAGDLYRRFRWRGVLVGAAVFGLFYALLSRIWYRMASLENGMFRFLIALYPATFFNGVPLRSVSETVWNWFWDFPKYLLVLLLLSWLVERLQRRLPHI